jgi:parallel beta-helix repeat protein
MGNASLHLKPTARTRDAARGPVVGTGHQLATRGRVMYKLMSLALLIVQANSAYGWGGDSPAPALPALITEASAATPVPALHLYVATTGSDSNSGTQTSPFRTITRAANVASPSTTVHVAPGTYRENVRTSVDGIASGRIRYVSDTKWGAKIIGSGKDAMWTNNGNYTEISGFDISGSGRLGILNTASHTLISNNHVHDLTVSGGCTGNGGAGINNGNYRGSDDDIIGNVVHDIGVPGKCNGVQGIYHSNLRGRIYNNIVYRASAYGIHLWHAADNVIVANNTVFANGAASVGGGIVIGAGDGPGGVVLNNTQVINNIVYNNPAASIYEYCYPGQNCIGSGNTIANNLVYRNGSGITLRAGSASGTIAADPQFVDYQANGTGNYRLKRTSPGVDKGVSSHAPSADIDNAARPRGAALDIGAYENY